MKKLLPLLFLAACIQVRVLPSEEVTYARKQAVLFAEDLNYKVLGVSCATNDPDGDGYTSCTVRVEPDTRIVLDCAYDKNSGIGKQTGCKEVRARAVQQTQ